MNHSEKFAFNTGLIMLAYAYAATGFAAAAVACGLAAAWLAAVCHSPNRLRENGMTILFLLMPMYLYGEQTGLHAAMRVLPLLSLCNVIYALLWQESSVKAIRETERILWPAAGICLIAAMILPPDLVPYLAADVPVRSYGLLSLVLLIFGPVSVLLGLKKWRYYRRHVMMVKQWRNRID